MFKTYAGAAAFAFAFAAGPLAAFAQSAAPAMHAMPAEDVASIDCATAPARMAAMMQPPAHAMDAMKPATSTDQTFDADMKMMTGHAMMLAKIEMKCGKDPKSMAAAKKMAEQLEIDHITFGNLF